MIKTIVSHAGEDDAFVDCLYEKLDRENLGLDIFVDHKRNLVGDDAQEMIDEVKKSIIFIPVFSNAAVKKDFILQHGHKAWTGNESDNYHLWYYGDDNVGYEAGNHMLEAEKIFITGIYGSGKTHLARKYTIKHNLPFFEFDRFHDYSRTSNQSKNIFESLPESFIIDAIPFNKNATWSDFEEYMAKNDVLVILVYCPDEGEWIRRVAKKRKIPIIQKAGGLLHVIRRIVESRKIPAGVTRMIMGDKVDIPTELRNYRR